MPDPALDIEPEYSAAELQELSHLEYAASRMGEFRDRNLIPAASYEVIATETEALRAAIRREGVYRATVRKAESLFSARHTTEALKWTRLARELEPDRREPWDLEISLLWELEQDAQAVGLCEEAATRFPALEGRLSELRHDQGLREKARKERAEQARIDESVAGRMVQIRSELKAHRDEQALALCQEVLTDRPDHMEALATAAFCHQRRGELDAALASYEHLVRLEPNNNVWSQWIQNIKMRRTRAALVGSDVGAQKEGKGSGKSALEAGAIGQSPESISWSGIAGEFLQEHWQKLLLCMAVLLIVVSSTVGAHVLLGDRLWSPLGKCALAMVGTLLFTALGMGLVRWGAVRAGQVMLMTTLAVVPIHFMLAGELGLVLEPSPFRLLGFAAQTAVLIALARVVSGMLVTKRDAWLIACPLVLASVFNALTSREAPGPWNLEFAAFQVPAPVFLAAVLSLSLGRKQATPEENRNLGYLLLGVLGFALLTSLTRTGIFALRLDPALFSLPLAISAVACIDAAAWIARWGAERRSVALLKWGGYVISGLALALPLARPDDPSPLHGGNLVATALVGMVLFVLALRAERHPAYLYAGFAACFLAYLGVHDLLHERLTLVEDVARRALGYPNRLPRPFRAITGWFFNVFLAGLSLFFRRRWQDDRLSRHCHYLGVPLSIAACIFSGWDSKAGLICLSGYGTLYLLGAWAFAAPWLEYLALGAICGAAYFASTLVPGITLGLRALVAAGIGLSCILIGIFLRGLGRTNEYRFPWYHGALALCAVAMSGAVVDMLQVGTCTFAGSLTFLVVALTACLENLEESSPLLGYVAVTCSSLAAAMGLGALDVARHWGLALDHYGVVAGAGGLTQACLGVWLGRSSGTSERRPALVPYIWPLRHAGLLVAGLAVLLGLDFLLSPLDDLTFDRWLRLALGYGLASSAFTVGTIWIYRVPALAYAAVWGGVATYLFGLLGVFEWTRIPHVWQTIEVALAGGSLLLYATWGRLRVELYRQPLLSTSLVLATLSGILSFITWQPSVHIALALTLSGLALVAVVGEVRRPALVHFSLIAFLGVWMKALEAFAGSWISKGPLAIGMVLTSFGLLALAVLEILWKHSELASLSDGDRKGDYFQPNRPRGRLFETQVPSFVVASSLIGVALAGIELGWSRGTALVLLMAGLGLLGASRWIRESVLVYLGCLHAVAAVLDITRWVVIGSSPGVVIGWLGVTLAVTVLILWIAGALCKRSNLAELYWVPCLNSALGLTFGVFGLAMMARIMTREAAWLSVTALAFDGLALLLIGYTRRWATLTYGAIATVVTASYVVLLSAGEPDPSKGYVLGLLAVILGLVFWSIGELCRRVPNEWVRGYAIPLYHWDAALTVLAAAPAYNSPWTMGLAAASFLLLIRGLPSTGWIYLSAAAAGTALYFPWLEDQPWSVRAGVCLVAAYGALAAGLLVRRQKPRLCSRLGLQPLEFESPLFQLAALGGIAAFGLKFDRTIAHGADLTSHPWIPFGLSPLAFGLMAAYPRRELAHVSLALLTWSSVSWIAPSLVDPSYLALAMLVVSVLAQSISPVIRKQEERLGRLLKLEDAQIAPIVRGWAAGLMAIGAALVCFVVFRETAAAIVDRGLGIPDFAPITWWVVLGALLLLGMKLVLVPLDRELDSSVRAGKLVVFAEVLGIGTLWWLGVASSPLRAWGLSAAGYYPLITALAALGIADLNLRMARTLPHETELQRSDASDAIRLGLWTSRFLVLLVLASAAFTMGRLTLSTIAAMVLGAIVSGLWTFRTGDLNAARAGSLVCMVAGFMAGLVVADRLAIREFHPRGIFAATSGLIAAYGLWFAAGLLRRGRFLAAGEGLTPFAVVRAMPERLALALERVGFGGVLTITWMAGLASWQGTTYPVWPRISAIIVLLAATLYFVLLVLRWKQEWLVYLAQAAFLGSYAAYRNAFSLPFASDAAVLVLFAFVDLGLAELMERLQLRLYARPMRFASLLLPLLPIVQLLTTAGWGELNVFDLLAAGTFYAVACGTMRWKHLGYAAGVLYNAALWVLWAQKGWRIPDHPQFFLVPVGLSAILFAEVNRRDLGRELVNSIRSIGMIVVYLAMAAPIWQYRSFADWVALLFGSLLGLFVGIGMRIQTFVWLGLVTFVANVLYELGRVSLDHALAKWAIMLSLGLSLVLFVALNEKKQIVATMRGYYDQIRRWE